MNKKKKTKNYLSEILLPIVVIVYTNIINEMYLCSNVSYLPMNIIWNTINCQ